VLAATLFRPPPTAGPYARDFEAYYAAGATWNGGGDPWSRDVWAVERTIPGVDASRDELLPFVGPAASLPLWSLLARLPFDVARGVWITLLVFALAALALATAALAHVRLTPSRAAGAFLFAALTGPVISDIALGQAALISAAAVALALLALEARSGWAIAAAFVAAIQPNLALPLAVRLTDRRAALLLAGAAAAFLALTFVTGGGPAGLTAYIHRLSQHGASERFILIQYSVPAILASFHLAPAIAAIAGNACSVLAVAVAAACAVRLRAQPRLAAAIAIAVLPWAVPFFHQHDFVIELIPVIILAASANARVRALAGVAALCVLVDWLGVTQRPHAAAQTVCLAFAVACAFAALPNRSLRAASPLPPLIASALLTLIAVPLALAFPATTWPDALGAFHAAANLDASAVWAAEQQRAGLDASVPAWGIERAIPLLGCALLAVAAYVAAGAATMTIRPARTASGTAFSDSP
jgi:Glycosyltransferase family 87